MSWRAEQQQFWDWITRPQDLRESAQQIDQLFTPHQHLQRAEALGIYNNAFHQRLIQIASEMFPVVYHTLGRDVFSHLWLEYLRDHLPRPGPMNRMASQLPDWVRAHPRFGTLPALLDIIRVEQLMLELFDRADEPALGIRELQAVRAAEWPASRWQPRNDWTLLESRFDLAGYWQKMQSHRDSAAEPGSASFGVMLVNAAKPEQTRDYLLHRRNFRMQLRPVTPALAGFLRLLQQPMDFAGMCEQLGKQHPDADIPQLSLSLLLEAIELELIRA